MLMAAMCAVGIPGEAVIASSAGLKLRIRTPFPVHSPSPSPPIETPLMKGGTCLVPATFGRHPPWSPRRFSSSSVTLPSAPSWLILLFFHKFSSVNRWKLDVRSDARRIYSEGFFLRRLLEFLDDEIET